jgi:tetratricopeptide (TPR) repeat protein
MSVDWVFWSFVATAVATIATILGLWLTLRERRSRGQRPLDGVPIHSGSPASGILPNPGPRNAIRVLGAPRYDSAFHGRSEDLKWLKGALGGTSRTVVLYGLGGRGKTRLAAEYVSREGRRQFKEGIVWLDCNDHTTSEDLFAACKERYELPPEASPEAVILRLSKSPTLVVLDNAENLMVPSDRTADWELVLRRIDPIGGSRVLVITRISGFADFSSLKHQVGPLDATSALRLLQEAATRENTWSELQPRAPEVVSLVQGHARLAEYVAGWVRFASVQSVVDQLREMQGADIETFLASAVHRIATQVAAQSGEDLEKALHAMTAFRGGFRARELVSLIGPHAEVTLRQLARADFVRYDSTAERYALDPIVERAFPPSANARQAHFELFATLVGEDSRDERRHPNLESELSNLRAAYDWGLEHTPIAAIRFSNALQYFLRVRALWEMAESLNGRSLPLARKLKQVPLEAACLLAIGSVQRRRYQLQAARLTCQSALTAYEGLRETIGVADAELRLGDIERTLGQYEVALERFDRCIIVYGAAQRPRERSYAIRRKADVLRLKGEFVASEALYLEAKRSLEEIGDSRGAETCEVGLIDILIAKHLDTDAAKRLKVAATTSREARDYLNLNRCQRRLSLLAWRSGDLESAERGYREAIELGDQIENLESVAIALFELAQVLLEHGSRDRAATTMRAATARFSRIGLEVWSKRADDCRGMLESGGKSSRVEGTLEV